MVEQWWIQRRRLRDSVDAAGNQLTHVLPVARAYVSWSGYSDLVRILLPELHSHTAMVGSPGTGALVKREPLTYGSVIPWCFKRLLMLTCALLLAPWIPVARAGAEGVSGTQNTGPGSVEKTIAATRVTVSPTVDGRLDEQVWTEAVAADEFLQREPIEGAPASERTEVRILYDEENLYFGFVLFDSDPSGIRATQLRRDSLRIRSERPGRGASGGSAGAGAAGRSDDTVTVILDTFHDHRNAFVFTVNALGTRSDATVRNEREVNQDWDERWEAGAQITERGWEAEMSIPWASLRYAQGNPIWGIDFRRQIRRKNEEVVWSNYSQDYEFMTISQAGQLQGLERLRLSGRFRLKPYALGGYNSFQQREIPNSESSATFGIEDFKIKLTSNLTSQLTYNTDFAQVEVDEQRINLTRFSLFFPEKREFFLEAANSFSFGNTEGGLGNPPPSRLFFSRRIGLDEDGNSLPIDFGAKLTGKVGRGNLGFLNVQTGDSQFGEGRNYTALRWRQDLFARSSVGAFISNVQGPGEDSNQVAGLDANFTFLDHLNISGFAAQGQDSEVENNSWIGHFQTRWESDLWEANAEIMVIEEDFRTDLGFIPRTNIIKQRLTGSYKPRPGSSWLRQIEINPVFDRITTTDGQLVTRRAMLLTRLTLESGDSFFATVRNRLELLDVPFDVHPTVAIPAGLYDFNQWAIVFNSYPGRRVSGGLSIRTGEFFDGDRLFVTPRLSLRMNENFSLRTDYSHHRVNLPNGSFVVHLARLRTDVSFSDRWLTDALVQYDSVTDEISLFGRLRYIYRTGDNFYLVYRQTRRFSGEFIGLEDRSLTAKMTYAFQW